MSAWRESELAADAKKVGIASEDARLIPTPPSLTVSTEYLKSFELVMHRTESLNTESKVCKAL